MFEDFYKILEVEPLASSQEIQKAFRRKAKDCHPDVCQDKDAQRFQKARQAYETLSDPDARAAYDREYSRQQESRNSRNSNRRFYRESKSRVQEGWHWPRFGNRQERFRQPPPVDAELTLSREQAARGGVYKLELPLTHDCPACQGDGSGQAGLCAQCRGRGSLTYNYKFDLEIVPHTRDETVVSAKGGPGGRILKILIRVA